MLSNLSLFKRVLLFAGILLLVCLLVVLFVFRDSLNIDGVCRWFKYMNVKEDGTYGSYSFDSHSSNAYGSLQDGLAVASVGGLRVFDAYGNELGASQAQISLPVLDTSERYAMLYDAGGSALLVMDDAGSEVLRLTEEKSVLDADLASDGSLCYSSAVSGYKSVLTVYDDRQQLVYRWLSSSVYMPVCSVSVDAEYLAAVGLGQKDGAFLSTLYLFRTDSEQISATVSLGGQLIYELQILEDGTVCAIGEQSAVFASLDGTVLGEYVFEDVFLKDYDAGGDGFLTLSVNMYKAGNRYSLLTVDHTGAELASLYIGQEILDISSCGKYIAVLTGSELSVYDRHFQLYYETTDIGTASAVTMRDDGSVILTGGGQGTLYIP